MFWLLYLAVILFSPFQLFKFIDDYLVDNNRNTFFFWYDNETSILENHFG